MSKKIGKLDVFVTCVKDLAKLSKCTDKQVAALITNEAMDQVHSIGINGGPIKGEDCLCASGKYTCIHAEANAIAKCPVSLRGATMICTYSPCVTCAALIINAGITRVFYIEEYKDRAGIEMMWRANIKVYKVCKVSEE